MLLLAAAIAPPAVARSTDCNGVGKANFEVAGDATATAKRMLGVYSRTIRVRRGPQCVTVVIDEAAGSQVSGRIVQSAVGSLSAADNSFSATVSAGGTVQTTINHGFGVRTTYTLKVADGGPGLTFAHNQEGGNFVWLPPLQIYADNPDAQLTRYSENCKVESEVLFQATSPTPEARALLGVYRGKAGRGDNKWCTIAIVNRVDGAQIFGRLILGPNDKRPEQQRAFQATVVEGGAATFTIRFSFRTTTTYTAKLVGGYLRLDWENTRGESGYLQPVRSYQFPVELISELLQISQGPPLQ